MDHTSAFILCIILLACLAATAVAAIVFVLRSRERDLYLRAAKNLVQEQFLRHALANPLCAAPPPARRRTMLYVRINTQPAMRFVFDPNENISVGRAPECSISAQDPLISQHHCRIFLHNGQVLLTDNGSGNGTCVRRGLFHCYHLRRGQAFVLRTADRICLGNLVLKITVFVFDDATM